MSTRSFTDLDIASALVALLFIALSITGCDQPAMYERNRAIDPSGWKISDSVEFEVPIDDSLDRMKFYLNLRHNTDYAYSNIYFFLNTWYPDGRYARDTIQLLLAGKDGKWLGQGFGKLKEVEVMLKDNVVFPMTGTYRFSFVQAMRTPSLEGIEDLGIRITREE